MSSLLKQVRGKEGSNKPAVTNAAMFGFNDDLPRVLDIALKSIHTNPDQPRKFFGEPELNELAASIERHGLKQPVLVKDNGDGTYLLLAGERRYRAHERLGRDSILAIPTEGDPDEIALIENLQREDLTPFEEAEALVRLRDRHGLTEAALGVIIGRSQPDVNKSLKLVGLPSAIKAEYPEYRHVASKSMLKELTMIPNEAQQLEMWEAVKGGLTVREVKQRKAALRGNRAELAAEPMTIIVSAHRALGGTIEKARTLIEHKGALSDEQRQTVRELHNVLGQILGE